MDAKTLVMTPADIIARAERAKVILNDPLVLEALSILESEVIEAYVACPTRDLEGMRLLQQELRRARKFKVILQGIIESGKLAKFDLIEKETYAHQLMKKFR